MTADTAQTTTPTADTGDTSRTSTGDNPNFIDNDLDRVPDKSFRDYGLDDRLVDALEAKGITHPFPIQELTLPVALQGQDIIGQARTGTGKTLGFGLPMIQRLTPDAPHTQALIVTPTRELCIQVYEELRICESMGYTSTTVYGGVGYEEQEAALTGGVDIVVGTPGRLLDMLGRGHLDLSKVSCVILDEADEMLDMGFLPDVERLLNAANEDDRHTMLFSATMPATVVKLARRYTDQPLFMGADSVEHETAPTVDQHFFQVFRMDKPRVLARILQQPERGNVYVFCRTKAMCDRLVRELEDLGVDAIAIHGDLRQAAREKNLDKFREGKVSVLVATEVAARGIDVDNVTHVVNYDLPDDEKMYLHRIGRTARAGAKGCAISFAEHNELARLQMIKKAVQEDGEVPEVFSTSDLLTELFELPDETPWGHLGKRGSGSSNRGGGGGSRGGSGGSRGGDRSGSREQPRGRRSSGSGGGSNDRSRSRTRHDSGGGSDRDRSRQRSTARSDDDRSSARSDDRSRDRSSGRDGGDRSRTRTRSGSSGSSDRDGQRDRSRSSSRGGGEPRSSNSRARSSSGSSGRVRARGGKPVDGERSRGDRGGSDDDGRSRGRSRTTDDRSSSGSDRDRSSSDRSRSGGGNRSGSGNERNGSNRGGSNRGGGGGNRSRGGSSNGNRSKSRNSRGGGGGGGRGGSQQDGRVSLPSKVRHTPAGTEARGEGQPRHSRRVTVEELP